MKRGMGLVFLVAIVALGLSIYLLITNLGLRGEIDDLKSQITSLDNDVGQYAVQMQGLQAQVDHLDEVTQPLEDLINFLREEFSELDI